VLAESLHAAAGADAPARASLEDFARLTSAIDASARVEPAPALAPSLAWRARDPCAADAVSVVYRPGMPTTTRRAGAKAKKSPGLLERLAAGPVICAEGYLFEFERRGYLQAGAYVPEVVLEHPGLVEGLHRDFVRAGSDVVEAFTYYAHRAKLKMVGREKDLARINRAALAIAKKVARSTGTLLAGDICNTSIYGPDAASHAQARKIFDEQIGWAVDAGVDFIVGETYSWAGEALLALEAIKRSGKPAVITLSVPREGQMRDGGTAADACKRLEQAGADVVGLNCARGPATTLPLLREVRAAVRCHVAGLPVPYRTTPAEPTFQSLTDPRAPENRPFPTGLDPFLCSRYEIAEFGKAAYEIGVRYLGVCCGAGPHHVRSLAEALGRRPEASKYSPDMSKHILFGTDKRLRQDYLEYARRNYHHARTP
jgi:betaine-homocysteine S-methyltransferase